MTSNRVLRMALGRPSGTLFSGKHDVPLSATPRLTVSSKDIHVVLDIHLYVGWCTQILQGDMQVQDHKFLRGSVGHVRRQTGT